MTQAMNQASNPQHAYQDRPSGLSRTSVRFKDTSNHLYLREKEGHTVTNHDQIYSQNNQKPWLSDQGQSQMSSHFADNQQRFYVPVTKTLAQNQQIFYTSDQNQGRPTPLSTSQIQRQVAQPDPGQEVPPFKPEYSVARNLQEERQNWVLRYLGENGPTFKDISDTEITGAVYKPLETHPISPSVEARADSDFGSDDIPNRQYDPAELRRNHTVTMNGNTLMTFDQWQEISQAGTIGNDPAKIEHPEARYRPSPQYVEWEGHKSAQPTRLQEATALISQIGLRPGNELGEETPRAPFYNRFPATREYQEPLDFSGQLCGQKGRIPYQSTPMTQVRTPFQWNPENVEFYSDIQQPSLGSTQRPLLGPMDRGESFNQTRPTMGYVPENRHTSNIKPPSFNGKGSFEDFILQFECLAQAQGWSEREKGLKLMCSLEGSAVGVLATIAEESRAEYYTLKNALSSRYAPKLDQDINGAICQSRRKKRGETYVAFAQELKRLVKSNYGEGWSQTQIETLTREKFFNALEDFQLKGLIWARKPATVEEAAWMADSLEKLQLEAKPDQRGTYYISTTPGTSQPRNQNYQRKEDESEDEERTKRKGGQQRDPLGCHFCGKRGHFIRECPDKKKKNDTSSKGISSSSQTNKPSEN